MPEIRISTLITSLAFIFHEFINSRILMTLVLVNKDRFALVEVPVLSPRT